MVNSDKSMFKQPIVKAMEMDEVPIVKAVKKPAKRTTETKKRVDKSLFLTIISRHLAETSDSTKKPLDTDLNADVRIITDSLDTTWSPFKATMAVVMAKVAYPDWDTRNHQKQLGGLFSLRTIDHNVICNELHRLKYYETDVSYAMTRAFERVERFTEDYSGILQPKEAKAPFLRICNRVNEAFDSVECHAILERLFDKLKERKVILDAMANLSVTPKTDALTLHGLLKMFGSLCELGAGASVVPELIVQSCCVICRPTLKMKDLKYHRTPDNTSRSLCDIEGYDTSDTCVLAVEVKCNTTITDGVQRTFDKKTEGIACRYILTTKSNTRFRVSEDNIVISSVADFCAAELMRVRHERPSIVVDMHAEVRKSVVATSCLSVGLKQQCLEVLDA